MTRILVALDTSPDARAALRAAVRLAARAHAELTGLFVEDDNLLRLAGLPFARAMVYGSAAQEALDDRRMALSLRAVAEQLRRVVAAEAEPLRVRWSFQVTRGSVAGQVLEAARDVDLVILGATGRAGRARGPLGSTARAVAARASRSVAVLRNGQVREASVTVLYSGGAAADHALDLAVGLARDGARRLTVLLPRDEGDGLRGDAARRLAASGLQVGYLTLPGPGTGPLLDAVDRGRMALLVVPADSPVAVGEALDELLATLGCAVVIAR